MYFGVLAFFLSNIAIKKIAEKRRETRSLIHKYALRHRGFPILHSLYDSITLIQNTDADPGFHMSGGADLEKLVWGNKKSFKKSEFPISTPLSPESGYGIL